MNETVTMKPFLRNVHLALMKREVSKNPLRLLN